MYLTRNQAYRKVSGVRIPPFPPDGLKTGPSPVFFLVRGELVSPVAAGTAVAALGECSLVVARATDRRLGRRLGGARTEAMRGFCLPSPIKQLRNVARIARCEAHGRSDRDVSKRGDGAGTA